MDKIKLHFIRKLNHYFPNRFCWTDCVHWALNSKSINPLIIMNSKPCRIESKQNGACYCGQFVGGKIFKRLSKKEKQLAKWIYWEDGDKYYCSECIEKRLNEINTNKEFSDDINYEDGDTCGYYEDYAQKEREIECCMCSSPLFSSMDC
jgi:hypothetical protein